MKTKLQNILVELDEWIEAENERRKIEEDYLLPKIIVRILGQCSLILHPSVTLNLFGTNDVDAIIKSSSGGFYEAQKKFIEILKRENLELDSDSHLIWFPQESTFTIVLETPRIKCEVIDPLFALCSKAIKAPEKNRILIQQALVKYGDDLKNLIQKHGGNLEHFK